MTNATIQQTITGEVLPNIGRRHAGMRGDAVEKAVLYRLGTIQQRKARAMSGNAQFVPQSVVKRVKNGGTHSAKELKRQLEYITRDEAVKSTWLNFNGVERGLYKNSVDTAVPLWTSGWAGNPKRGHTDHIILSFPKDTDIESAETVAKEWGRAIFGSGDFGDQWRYMAALHANTDHVHAHFVVEKHGIEHGNFLSISNKSELNFDVMREMHAKIAQEHGLALNASSRFSRGITERPPREIEYRKAHEAQQNAGQGGDKPKVEAPPMSPVERMKREAIVRNFAKQYKGLSELAQLAKPTVSGSEFMSKLGNLFGAAADKLEEGNSLMTDITTEPAPFDPSERLALAQEQLVSDARQAWDDIQQMESGPERVSLEAQFSTNIREAREMVMTEPFFDTHGTGVARDTDPYHLGVVGELNDFIQSPNADPSALQQANDTLDEIRSRLVESFDDAYGEMTAEGTSAAEMAERFLIAERTTGQLQTWSEGGYNTELANDFPEQAKAMVEEFKAEIVAEAERNGAEVDWDQERTLAEEQLRKEHNQDRAEFGERYGDWLDDVKDRAANIVDDYELPRDLSEAMARDQLMDGEKYNRLADVPAIERIVDRLSETLSEDDLEAVRSGDSTALREEIQDPAIRAAVTSELRNEADVADNEARHSEPVEQFQLLARQNSAKGVEKEAIADVSDDYGI